MLHINDAALVTTVTRRLREDPTIVECADGHTYKFKAGDRDSICESAAYHMAAMHGVPTLNGKQVTDEMTGERGWGWQWENGSVRVDQWQGLLEAAQRGDCNTLRSALTRIFILDLYLHNTDRHLGNLLVVPNPFGQSIKAIDYAAISPCFVLSNPSTLLSPATNTIRTMEILLRYAPLDLEAAEQMLQRMLGVNLAKVTELHSKLLPEYVTAMREYPQIKQYIQDVEDQNPDLMFYRDIRIASIRKALRRLHTTGRWRGGAEYNMNEAYSQESAA